MLATAESAAAEARKLCADLAGHPLWAAQAASAASEVALARGNVALALENARFALNERRISQTEDPHLEFLVPAARAILGHSEDEAEKFQLRMELKVIQSLALQRTLDDDVRVRWLRGPMGSQLAELAGPFDGPQPSPRVDAEPSFEETDTRLLRLLTEGKTNAEIASDLGVEESVVTNQLTALYATHRRRLARRSDRICIQGACLGSSDGAESLDRQAGLRWCGQLHCHRADRFRLAHR